MARSLKAVEPKEVEPSKPKIIVSGRPGVGKTWWALDFPSVYYVDVESGADLMQYQHKLKESGGVYFGIEQGSRDFDTVIEEVISLATVKHSYKTLVIDSFSKLFNTQVAITEDEMRRLKKEPSFGSEKKEATQKYRKLLYWLDKLDMNVILICHEKEKWGGTGINRVVEGYTYDAPEKLEYELHLHLRVVRKGDVREGEVKKTRLAGFPEGERILWDYNAFADRYGKSVIERESANFIPATIPQLEKLNELLEALSVTDEQKEKMLSKAGAESFKDVSSDTTELWIKQLQERISNLTK